MTKTKLLTGLVIALALWCITTTIIFICLNYSRNYEFTYFIPEEQIEEKEEM